jgi:hypothetical protein
MMEMLREILSKSLLALTIVWPVTVFGFDYSAIMAPSLSPSRMRNIFRYSGMLAPRTSFGAGAAEHSGIQQQNLGFSIPVYKEEKDLVTISGKVNWLDVYPDRASLSDLYDIQIGCGYTHSISDRQSWSVVTSFGSASDKPFVDSSVDTINATAFYSLPNGEFGAWLFLLNYSNNRTVLNNIPIPGVAYSYSPSKMLKAFIGIPFAMVYWQLDPKWAVSFSTVLLMTKAQIAYTVFGPAQVYAGVDFTPLTFMQYARADQKERLYYDERKMILGVRSPISRVLMTELEFGYAFERKFFTATNYTSEARSRLDLESDWFGRIGITAGF